MLQQRYRQISGISCVRSYSQAADFSIASVAVGGFYSYNGMDFYEYMGKKLKFMFSNHPLVYMSTEGDLAIKEYQMEQLGTGKKKKTKRILFVSIGAIVAAVAGLMAYKYMQ